MVPSAFISILGIDLLWTMNTNMLFVAGTAVALLNVIFVGVCWGETVFSLSAELEAVLINETDFQHVYSENYI